MKFGILCAMEEELHTLLINLENKCEKKVGDITFYLGTINNVNVVLTQSGIGKVSAGLSTGLLISLFKVDVVINSGSAAGIGGSLKIGDVVISNKTAYWDVDATAAGYRVGQLPQEKLFFKASNEWIDRIEASLSINKIPYHVGLIVSGDSFVSSKKMINTIKNHFPDALSCEMEGAAVGQVATKFNVPYLVIRAISDNGDESANDNFDQFIVDAGRKSAQVLLDLISNCTFKEK